MYDFILDGMIWSFSRLNAFGKCNYEWYLQYIECVEGVGGFFSDFGSFMHDILEKYLKRELSFFELVPYYENHFNERIHFLPPKNNYVDLSEIYYEKGLDYLMNLDLSPENFYSILGIEKKVQFSIKGHDGKEFPFVGYIDLLVEDDMGNITVIDHKSSSIKILNNGKISKPDQEHFLEFKRQLYLYSIAVIDEYKRPPKKLKWNMFKDRTWIEIDFNMEEYEEAIEWAKNTLEKIYKEKDWLPDNNNEFFCNNLCSMRMSACPYKKTNRYGGHIK